MSQGYAVIEKCGEENIKEQCEDVCWILLAQYRVQQ
jgi:hypothetical protein